jgi:hypothetical protein
LSILEKPRRTLKHSLCHLLENPIELGDLDTCRKRGVRYQENKIQLECREERGGIYSCMWQVFKADL